MAETQRPWNVLFLCTGNSARSILAESILRHEGGGRFHAFSAGSHPTGRVNPHAIESLRRNRFPTDDLHSKSWNEFESRGAPPLDLVITVCDNAAGEVCPVWPGRPVTAHWGVPDPVAVDGSESEMTAAFTQALHLLLTRIRLLTNLPLAELEPRSLQDRVREIGNAT